MIRHRLILLNIESVYVITYTFTCPTLIRACKQSVTDEWKVTKANYGHQNCAGFLASDQNNESSFLLPVFFNVEKHLYTKDLPQSIRSYEHRYYETKRILVELDCDSYLLLFYVSSIPIEHDNFIFFTIIGFNNFFIEKPIIIIATYKVLVVIHLNNVTYSAMEH